MIHINTTGSVSATEMSNELARLREEFKNLSKTISEHLVKVILSPDDISQNKWRNEIASRLVEIDKKTAKAYKGRKLPEKEYDLAFEPLIDLSQYLEDHEVTFEEQGYVFPTVTADDVAEAKSKLLKLIQAAKSIFTDKSQINAGREAFREIIDDIL